MGKSQDMGLGEMACMWTLIVGSWRLGRYLQDVLEPLPVLNFDILQDRQKGLPLFTLARFVDEDTAVCMDRCVYLHIQTTVLARAGKRGKR